MGAATGICTVRTQTTGHLRSDHIDWWPFVVVLVSSKLHKTTQFPRQLSLWWPILLGLLTATLLYLEPCCEQLPTASQVDEMVVSSRPQVKLVGWALYPTSNWLDLGGGGATYVA